MSHQIGGNQLPSAPVGNQHSSDEFAAAFHSFAFGPRHRSTIFQDESNHQKNIDVNGLCVDCPGQQYMTPSVPYLPGMHPLHGQLHCQHLDVESLGPLTQTQQMVEKNSLNQPFLPPLPLPESHGEHKEGSEVADPKTAALLSKSWSSAAEASAACREHAAQMFNHTLVQGGGWGGKHIPLICKCNKFQKDAPHCPLRYSIRKSAKVGYYLKRDECNFQPFPTCLNTHIHSMKELLVNPQFLSMEKLETKGKKMGPKAIQESMSGMCINGKYITFQRALQKARSNGGDELVAVTALIEPYLAQISVLNQNSHFFVDRWEDGRFKSAALVLGDVCEVVSKIGLPVIGLDGQKVGNPLYDLSVMTVECVVPLGEAKDCDDSNGRHVIVPAAKIVHSSECADAFKSMISLARKVSALHLFLNQPNLVCFSDRGKAVLKAISESIPTAIGLNCALHILRNAVHNSKEEIDESLFWKYRNATTFFELQSCRDRMRHESPKTFAYLEHETDLSSWQVFSILRKHPLCRMYGIQTSNLVEQEHARSTNTGSINSNPLMIFQGFLLAASSSLRLMVERCSKLIEQKKLLTEPAVKSLERQRQLACGVLVKRTHIPHVYLTSSLKSSVAGCINFLTVDLFQPHAPHGTCKECSQYQTICRHYLAAYLFHSGQSYMDPAVIGIATIPQLLAYSHHPGYLTAHVNNALKKASIAIPDLETLTPSNLKPTVPYNEIPVRKRKKSGPVKRFNSRGEVSLNKIRAKKSKAQS